MRIESKRLYIRPYQEADFEDYCRLSAESPMLGIFAAHTGIFRAALQETIEKRTEKHFSILLKGEDSYCGEVVLQKGPSSGQPELGITILSAFQGMGIGPEAIIAFGNYCCEELGLFRMEVRIEPTNTHSIHVFRKLGAVFVEKKADYTLQLTKLADATGATLPVNIDEELGSYHFYLNLPISHINEGETYEL